MPSYTGNHISGTTTALYATPRFTTSRLNEVPSHQRVSNSAGNAASAPSTEQSSDRTASSIDCTLAGRFVNSGRQYYGPTDEVQYYEGRSRSVSPESDTECLLDDIVSPVYGGARDVQNAFHGVSARSAASTGYWAGSNASLRLVNAPQAGASTQNTTGPDDGSLYEASPPACMVQQSRPSAVRLSRPSGTGPPQSAPQPRQMSSRPQSATIDSRDIARSPSTPSGSRPSRGYAGGHQHTARSYRGTGPGGAA